MKYTKPIRWGIIGCGDVTEKKSGPAYKLTEGFELSAVMRRNKEKLMDYANRHQIATSTTDADAVINDKNIDAIYIATPPDAHLHYALKVAEAGKPCCIEKPLAPSYEESLKIYESFQQKDIPLFVTYYRRSLPRFEQIHQWIREGRIGEIRHLSWQLTKAPNALDLTGTYNWRTDPKIAEGGYFDDLACHGMDLFTYMLGDVKEVLSTTLKQQQLYKAKDAVVAAWIHKNNITGSGSWNFNCDRNDDHVEILGSTGRIKFSVFQERPIVLDTINEVRQLTVENPVNIQLNHVQNMAKALFNSNYQHPSMGKSAVHTSWIIDQMLGR